MTILSEIVKYKQSLLQNGYYEEQFQYLEKCED